MNTNDTLSEVRAMVFKGDLVEAMQLAIKEKCPAAADYALGHWKRHNRFGGGSRFEAEIATRCQYLAGHNVVGIRIPKRRRRLR